MKQGRMTAGPGSVPYPEPAYAWYVVVVLTLGYVVSFLDRQILAMLVEPIKHDMQLSDTQMGLLGGLAFAIFYTVLGIPIGRMADRYSRRTIIAAGISIWCAMTAACGLARNYSQFFLARIGVGIGEASLAPSALSLISDYFPLRTRGRAISFYSMGVSVGAGIAMIAGGKLIALATPISLPFIGELYAWQTIFIWVGLPGLLIAGMMVTVKEPARQGKMPVENPAGSPSDQVPVRVAVRFLADHWKTYGGLFLGMSGATVLGYGFLFWLTAMFERSWDSWHWLVMQDVAWNRSTIVIAQGILLLVFGPLGVNLGGWLADRSYNSGNRDGHLRILIFSGILMLASSTLLPLVPGPELALLLFIPEIIGSAGMTAIGSAALMMITPNQLCGQITAIYYFVISITGLTIGPSAVAFLTDQVFANEADLRYSISIVSGIWGSLAVLCIATSRRHYRRSISTSVQWGG